MKIFQTTLCLLLFLHCLIFNNLNNQQLWKKLNTLAKLVELLYLHAIEFSIKRGCTEEEELYSG